MSTNGKFYKISGPFPSKKDQWQELLSILTRKNISLVTWGSLKIPPLQAFVENSVSVKRSLEITFQFWSGFNLMEKYAIIYSVILHDSTRICISLLQCWQKAYTWTHEFVCCSTEWQILLIARFLDMILVPLAEVCIPNYIYVECLYN